MAMVFGFFAFLTTGVMVTALVAGFLHWPSHLLWGVGAAIAAICCHSLIFAIFTGSGKDTRLLVEDWGLDTSFVKKAKAFKRDIFPPALYAIFWVLLIVLLGGILSRFGSIWARWSHAFVAVTVTLYNIRIFILETKAIAENGRLIKSVNAVAAVKTSDIPPVPDQFTGKGSDEKVFDLDFETHAYALGRFLTFLGLNVWLVFLYVRVIMGMITIPTWPFVLVSGILFLFGFWLRLYFRKSQQARAL